MRRDTYFWIAVGVSSIVTAAMLVVYAQRLTLVEERIVALSSLQEGQLELFRERVGLLITLATLVLGGSGTLMLHFHEKNTGTVAQQRLAGMALLSAVLAALCGYLTYDAAIGMLRLGFFNLETGVLRLFSGVQLWMSMLALMLLACCFLAASGGGDSSAALRPRPDAAADGRTDAVVAQDARTGEEGGDSSDGGQAGGDSGSAG